MTAAELSVMTLWAATTLYAIAMVAGAIHVSALAEVAPEERGSVRTRARGIARATTLVGLVMHAVGLVARGIEAGHTPWSNMYEYTITGSFVAVLVYMIFTRKRDGSWLGPLVTGLATIALGLGLAVLYGQSTGLRPALQSYWLVIHVSIAIISTGVFAVGFLIVVLQLLQKRRELDPERYTGRVWRMVAVAPDQKTLSSYAYRLHAVGFVLWTFTVMSGALWAEDAWGRFWGWDPKEVWSFVIWVIYAAYLHARATTGLNKAAPWIAIAGFVALIMNFTVVNYVFQGLHTYAGNS